MALTLKSPSTARYSIFSMPSRLGNWNSTSGSFTVASVSLKEMQICREPQQGRLTHHSSQASLPTTCSLGAGQMRWLLMSRPHSLAQPPPCPAGSSPAAPRSASGFCNKAMRQTQSESQVSVLIALTCVACKGRPEWST